MYEVTLEYHMLYHSQSIWAAVQKTKPEGKNLADETLFYSGTKCEHIIKNVFAMAQRIFCISQYFRNRTLSKLCQRNC